MGPLALGIDFGTSGARIVVVAPDGSLQSEQSQPFDHDQQQEPLQRPQLWQTTLMKLLSDLPLTVRQQIGAIAINGTSATVMLCDRQGHAVLPPRLYNEGVGPEMVEALAAIAPTHHPVLSTSSSLAKLFQWLHDLKDPIQSNPIQSTPTINRSPSPVRTDEPLYFLHQADWLAFLLHGRMGISDYHNSLKLGYDVGTLAYPNWFAPVFEQCTGHSGKAPAITLPQVVAPGQIVGTVTEKIVQLLDIPSDCVVCAGTTDSIAAFLASGVQQPGEAVTSLGSTLVLKLLSTTRVDEAQYGVYSHRLGNMWLVGGASNTGGAVLRQFFSDQELIVLSERIPWQHPSPFSYYPLLKPGERFPLNDPHLVPCLDPRPDDPAQFLHGLLESMARIEAQGYQRLQQLGATPLTTVFTAGGGAKNETWTKIRSRRLGLEVRRLASGDAAQSPHTEAAYGSARLALKAMLRAEA